jgi:hypothetical protein
MTAPLARAHAVTSRLLTGTRALHASAAVLEGLELRHVRRMLHPLLEAVAAGDPVTVVLATGTAGGALRAVRAAVVAAAMTHALRLPRAAAADLTAAALLVEPASDPALAVRRLAHALPLTHGALTVLRAAHGGSAPATTDAAVVRLAGSWVAALAHAEARADGPGPSAVLASVLASGCAGTMPALAAALVRAVGVHPPGQVVRLDDGRLARVVAAGPEPERPWVRVPCGESGAVTPLASGRVIAAALPRAEWPLDDHGTLAA